MHRHDCEHWERRRRVSFKNAQTICKRCSLIVFSIYSVDLTVANRVHLLEPHWNPMVEAQAVDRVHRIGQTRDVLITRYIIRDSVETVGRVAKLGLQLRAQLLGNGLIFHLVYSMDPA